MKKSKIGWTISIDFLPKTRNELERRHYREVTNEKNRVYTAVGFHVRRHAPKKPFKKASLTLIRHSSVEPDWDGLISSFKYVVDALVHYKLIVDDKMENIGRSHVHWKKAPPKKGFITVRFFGIE